MGLQVNGENVSVVRFNGTDLKELQLNGETVWTSQPPSIEYNFYNNGQTLQDGIVSGLNYAPVMLPAYTFQPGNNTWEIGLKFRTSDNVSTRQFLYAFQKDYGTNNRYGVTASINSGKFEFGLSTDGSTWMSGVGTVNSFTVQPETDYFLKEWWDGTSYKITVSENEGEPQELINVQNSTPIYNSLHAHYIGARNILNANDPFLGEIDVNQSYYKIADKLQKPLNYILVSSYNSGRDVLYEGVMQYQSSISYATLKQPFQPGNRPWEINIKFVNGVSDNTSQFLFRNQQSADNSGRYGIGINKYVSTQHLEFVFSLDGTSWWNNTIVSDYTLVQGEKYWLREWWDGNAYRASISTDGVEYEEILNIPGTIPIFNGANTTYIGAAYVGSSDNFWKGEIDLNETYFTIK